MPLNGRRTAARNKETPPTLEERGGALWPDDRGGVGRT
jgi:hypothetical protein